MHHVELFVLVTGAVAVTAVCRRRGWPAPLVLVAVAIVVSFVPGVPRYEIEPEILLEFVLPPLLYSAALSSSYRDFRSSLNSITRLGVGPGAGQRDRPSRWCSGGSSRRSRSRPRSCSAPSSRRRTRSPRPPSASGWACRAA